MNSQTPRRISQPTGGTAIWWVALGVICAGIVATPLVWLAAALGGAGQGGLVAWLRDPAWSATATTILVATGVVLALLAGVCVWAWLRNHEGATRVDARAKYMATAADMTELSEKAAASTAARLGITTGTGCRLGRAVRTGKWLVSTWEWTQLWIMGPRAGKTTAVCIPQLVETRGPALGTSNKRDLVDHCRGPRSEVGKVWVSDPQGICGEEPSWAWDPLSYIRSVPGREVEKAKRLAGLWAAAAMAEGAQKQDYWMSTAQSCLSGFLLAASTAERPVTQVHQWANNVENATEATDLLREHGFGPMADTLEGILALTPRQRDGVIGAVQTMLDFLANPQILPWITVTAYDTRPVFDPAAFVRSTDTIFLLSKEGAGSARAVTAALTVAVAEAAEEYATTQRGGRLAVPLLVMLDEAANICRWPELPGLYSHYGSRGIVLCTILQSYTQGEEVWGREGMRKLWSAANIRVVGKGDAEATFLDELSKMIGDHEYRQRSVSTSRKSPASVSQSVGRSMILDAADLAAMPSGRAVLLTAGVPAVLLKLVPWWQRPEHAEAIKDSNAYYSTTGVPA